MKQLNDAALVEGLKSRETACAEEFLERYFEDSARFAFSITGDHSAAEDIAQDALVLALEKIDTFQTGRAFRPWFLKIVENRAREYMRGESRRKRRDLEFSKPRRAFRPPSQTLEEKEEAALIRDHLSRLDDDCRTILSLRFLESLSLRDIAESMNCPQGTVSTKIRRGLERLSRSLSPALSVTPGALGILLTKMGRGSVGGGAITASGGRGWFTAKAGIALGMLPFLVATTLLLKSPTDEKSEFGKSHESGKERVARGTDLSASERALLSSKKEGRAESEERPAMFGRDFNESQRTSSGLVEAAGAGGQEDEKSSQKVSVDELRFRVVDSSGQALLDLPFRVYRPTKNELEPPFWPLGQVESDAQGRCQLTLDSTIEGGGNDRIEIRGPGKVKRYLPFSKAKDGVLNGGTLVLDETELTTVRVRVSFMGQEVPEANVHVLAFREKEEADEDRRWLHRAESDERGWVSWYPDQMTGELKIQLEVEAKGYAFVSRAVKVLPGRNELRVSLKKAEPFSGFVVDPWGKPVPKAWVFIDGLFQYQETDALGRFELDHLSRGQKYKLVIRPPDKGVLISRSYSFQLPTEKREFALGLGGEVEAQLQLPPGVNFAGLHALNLVGKTKEGKSIDRFVKFAEWPVRVFNIPPGRYVLHGYPFSGVTGGQSEEFEIVAGGQKQSVTILHEPCREIRGRLVDPEGSPIGELWVEVDVINPSYDDSGSLGFFSLQHAPRHGFSILVTAKDGHPLGRFYVPPSQGTFDLGELVVARPKKRGKKKDGKLKKSE